MKTKIAGILILYLLFCGCSSMEANHVSSLSQGTAPDFTLPDQNENPVSLSRIAKAHQGVVVAFYPKDDSRN